VYYEGIFIELLIQILFRFCVLLGECAIYLEVIVVVIKINSGYSGSNQSLIVVAIKLSIVLCKYEFSVVVNSCRHKQKEKRKKEKRKKEGRGRRGG